VKTKELFLCLGQKGGETTQINRNCRQAPVILEKRKKIGLGSDSSKTNKKPEKGKEEKRLCQKPSEAWGY